MTTVLPSLILACTDA